jgi:hypothetical protein
MARRKGWDQLSDNYRRRLERGGIRKSDYEGGIPLDIARGHGETPEHGLTDAVKDPERWFDYIQEHKENLTTDHIQTLHDWLQGNSWPQWAYPTKEWSFLFYHST